MTGVGARPASTWLAVISMLFSIAVSAQSGTSVIAGLVKDVTGAPIPDGTRLEVRAEAYNLLNRASFNIPGYTLGAADFGVISSARPARTIQLASRVSF